MNTVGYQTDEPRLLVVAENLLSRAGLTALLEERGFRVLAQVDGARLQGSVDQYEPDELVVDFGWDQQLMRRRLFELEADLPVLALVSPDEDAELSPLVTALRPFPQFALLLRDCDSDVIVAALEALASGLSVIDPRLATLLSPLGRSPQDPPLSPLTAREKEVLQLLARGLTNRAIALELGITQHTVKFHVNAIMSKLGAQSRTEAVVRATQLGMILL
ncbi:MAG: response regulator transcription factor [Chloroflexi bacterium]|nr:response regulator transcription factor [Chloroflexota bacterium]